MSRSKKIIFFLCFNLLLLAIIDILFGRWVTPPPVYLNTKNQYTSNYRNYFVQKTDLHGNTYFGVEESNSVTPPLQHSFSESKALNVLALGDSFTQGQGVKPQDTWIKQLEKFSTKKKINGINHGYAGVNIREIHNVFMQNIAQTDAQLIVYAFVLNDPISNATTVMELDFDNQNEYPRDYGLYNDLINYRSIVFDKNRNRLLQFLYQNSHMASYLIRHLERKMTSLKTITYYQNLNDPAKNQAGLASTFELIQEMNELTTKKGSRFLVMIFPIFYSTQKNYPFIKSHEYLRSELKKRHIDSLDLLASYQGLLDSDLWVHPVDQHPNDFAHSIAAKALFTWMIQKDLI